jgi:hypothetical protein
VRIPTDAKVYIEASGTKWKTNKMELVREVSYIDDYTHDLDVLIRLCSLNRVFLRYISMTIREELGIELYFRMVRINGYAIMYVPDHILSYELCMTAINQTGMAIQLIPNHLISYDLCLAAVRKNGWAFYYISKEFQTLELYQEAIGQDRKALQFVPKQFTSYIRFS